MKKQSTRRHCASLLLITLAATSLPACGKPAQPGVNASQPASASPQAAQASILSFADFVQAEGGEAGESSSSLSAADSILKPATKTDPGCDSQCLKYRQEFRYVVYVGKQIYQYWDLKKAETKTDYDALSKTFEKSIITDTSPTAYYEILSRWAASFHDGHVNAMYKSDDSDYEVFTAPVRLEVLAPATKHEKVILSQFTSAKGFSPDQLDLQQGDEVLSVNGVAIHKALDEAAKLTSGSTERMRRSDGARRLVDAIGVENGATPLVLKVQRPEQEPHEVTLYRTAELSIPPSSDSPEKIDTGKSYFSAVVLPGSMGYLRIDSFEGTKDEFLLAESMKLLSKTQGLLIDVRRNEGGDQSGDVVLSRLTNAAITRYRSSPRMSDFTLSQRPYYFNLSWTQGNPFADWYNNPVKAADAKDLYGYKPVVLLTGVDCFSACDTFTSAIKVNRLGTVVGEPTGGGTGQPLSIQLPNSKMSFRYGVVRGMAADGSAIEGVGTQPDQLIERTQEERISGHDEQLLSALRLLRKQISERTGPIATPGSQAANAAAQSEVVINAAVRGVGPVWGQSTDMSPSRALDRALRRVSAIDEAAAAN